MLQKSSQEELCGCLGFLVGSLAGFLVGVRADRAAAEAALARDPDLFVDWLPVGAMGGLILGGLGAAVVGMVVGRVLTAKGRGG